MILISPDIVILDDLELPDPEAPPAETDGLDARYNERFAKRMESLKRAVSYSITYMYTKSTYES